MKKKLSFAERLVRQSSSKEKVFVEKSSLSAAKAVKSQPTPKSQYMQFKEQHNQLKSMLKLFEPAKGCQYEQLVELAPASPVRNRLNQKKYTNKTNNIQIKLQPALQAKQFPLERKLPKILGGDLVSFKSQVLARTEWLVSPLRRKQCPSQAKNAKKGIPNIGNTCYINAIVQCLFHLPHFNDYFADEKYRAEKNGRNKDVVEMYRELYRNVMRNSSQVDLSTLPLKRSVSTICSLFIDWEQEDAHEFMKELLNSIHDELNRVKSKPTYRQMHREVEAETLEKMAGEFWAYQKSRDDSYIYDSLCGQTYNNIRCINCNHESQCFENFLDLSLPMANSAKSLEDLLQDYFQPEKLSDYYLCGKCNKSSKKSTKTVQLWRVPRFLIIHLKRSQFTKKNVDPIMIPQSLTLKPFMTLSNDRTAKFCQYSLCGIIMHQGVMDGGHYWCNVKENGKWYELDDDRVRQLNGEEFKKEIGKDGSSTAYILLYSSLY